MKNKKETMEKIKQAALEEFYEKGYAKASLRTICSRAGVTTGAMYFSFENKEALFRAILEPLVQIATRTYWQGVCRWRCKSCPKVRMSMCL